MASAIEEIADPLCIRDIFAEGLADIQKIGSCIRFTLYAEQCGAKIVVARIVLPAIPTAFAINEQVRAFLGGAMAN